MIRNFDVFLWNRKVGSLVVYSLAGCLLSSRTHCLTIGKNCGSDLLELAKRYNIRGADAIIEKAIGVVSNYDHYAGQAGVNGYWCRQIKEETGYRIENMSDAVRHRGIGRH